MAADREPTDPKNQTRLIEAVVSTPNMRRAYKRVVSNGGAPGLDSVRTDELADWLSTLGGDQRTTQAGPLPAFPGTGG